MKIFLLAVFLVAVAMCAAVTTRTFMNSNLVINGSSLTLNTNDPTVNFLVLGDWGGVGVSVADKALAHATPSGMASASMMGSLGSTYNTKFQIGLGDNFYFYGVRDANDKIIQKVFEQTYTANQLKNTPWFQLLGNHDWYGNAQGQIDYMAKSNRWILPNYNYTVNVMTANAQTRLISIVVIDTVLLCGNNKWSILSPYTNNVPAFADSTQQKLATLYFADLEAKLAAINATRVPYIIVAGHYPVYSVADSGSTQCLINNLMPLLHKYKVSAYLAGHDHDLQHISFNNLGSTVEYFVSGANSLNTASSANLGTLPSGSLKFQWPTSSASPLTVNTNGGFLLVQASTTSMTVSFVRASPKTLFGVPAGLLLGYNSNIIYTKTIAPRS